jgi:superfamily II DNA or RNA helicase
MKYHPVLNQHFKNWDALESQIEALPTTKSRGDAFEDFVFAYFQLNKDFYQIDEHWKYADAPIELKLKLGMDINDCGADGLIKLKDGSIAAYQAKFRTGRETPPYHELTKLWAESRLCDYQYIVANCYSLTDLAKKNKKHLQVLCDKFDNLDEFFFGELYNLINSKKVVKKFYMPESYQVEMIEAVKTGFETADRGKLIAACGTGKTLTALWITESLDAKNVLFIAPSIALVKQTLEAWANQAKTDFDYVCICSDKSVSDGVDEGDLDISEVGIPVSTDIDEITEKLSKPHKGKRYIFSTYQSLNLISKASKSLNFRFDFGIFDEAHRTAGTNSSALFSLGLDDSKIKIKKRLFMTATERLVRPWIIEKASELNRTVFSMNDEASYGQTFYRYSFGTAIKQNVISDYKIIVAGITNNEVFNWIRSNALLVDVEEDSTEYISGAENIFKQLMLVKAMKAFPIKKCITFHATVKMAKEFINGTSQCDFSLKTAIAKLWKDVSLEDVCIDHLNGEMTASVRHQRLEIFAKRKYGVVSNARCLTEGIDVPIIDSIYFVNPKNSLIDIVQACGRALRKPRGPTRKTAYFIVPVLIPEDCDKNAEAFNKIDFEMIHNLIQSLRDQDQRMEQWIDKINLGLAAGGKKRIRQPGGEGPIVLELPKEFSVEDFETSLYLKIAEVNRNPTQVNLETKPHTKDARKSKVKRVFRTLGDYTVESYKNSLVLPTLAKFINEVDKLTNSELKVDHNNVSHTERLGIIKKDSESNYSLTEIGKKLYRQEVGFEEIFKSQMLKFFELVKKDEKILPLYSYRTVLHALANLGQLNFYEYIFCIYTIKEPTLLASTEALDGIQYLRKNYPNLEALGEKNRIKVLKTLNDHFGTEFQQNDIWTKNTTAVNQWNYMRGHISLFDDIVQYDSKNRVLSLKTGKRMALKKLLLGTRVSIRASSIAELFTNYQTTLIQFIKFKI